MAAATVRPPSDSGAPGPPEPALLLSPTTRRQGGASEIQTQLRNSSPTTEGMRGERGHLFVAAARGKIQGKTTGRSHGNRKWAAHIDNSTTGLGGLPAESITASWRGGMVSLNQTTDEYNDPSNLAGDQRSVRVIVVSH